MAQVLCSSIRFSQTTISHTLGGGHSVQGWHDRQPYTNAINVVEWEDETYTSLDDRK